MSISVIADSSGLISLISDSDQNHNKALKITQKFADHKGTVIIPSDVFTEVMNVVGKKMSHQVALKTALIILGTETFTILDSDGELRTQALAKFEEQPESVSFTDCIVMVFADKFQTKAIFGFDEVFSKNGYKRLG